MNWPTDSTAWILFGAGLLGGAGHCVGMCGPLIAGYALSLPDRRATLPHLLFNLGRTVTYAIAGGVVGLTGSFVRVVPWIEPVQRVVLGLTGILVVLLGLSAGGWLPWMRRIESAEPFRGPIDAVTRRVAEAGGPGASFPLGLAAGLLPCGLVYTALLSAARAGMDGGSPAEGFLRGFLAMAAFGAGTFPALFLFGKAVGLAGVRLRGILARGAALLLVAGGALFAIRAILG